MSVALRGNLEDFGIADVFQLIGQQRKTGILELTGLDGRHAELRFDRGAVVSAAPSESRTGESLGEMLVRCGLLTHDQVDDLRAECVPSGQNLPRLAVVRSLITEEELEQIEDLLTRETIFSVLRWSEGSFDFRAQEVLHNRRFETLLGAEQILMDGLRMVDEWQSFADLVPSDDAIFQKVGRFESYRDHMNGEQARHVDRAERVFSLIDGRLTVRRVIDLSLLGSFDAIRALAGLHEAGVIEPLDTGSLQKLRRRSRPRVLPKTDARGWIAALAPIVMLAAIAIAIHVRNSAPQPAGLYPIPPSAMDLVRDGYATLRVRHALEAYRFANGEWPARLSQLSARNVLSSAELASEQGRPYYYMERAEGAVLLAPER